MITKHQSRSLSQACSLLLVFLLLGAISGAARADGPELAKERDKVRSELRKVGEDFERSRAAKSREHRELGKLQSRLDQTRRETRILAEQQAVERDKLAALQAELRGIESEREGQLERLQHVSMLHSRARARAGQSPDAAARTRNEGWLRLVGQQRATLLEKLSAARQHHKQLMAERQERLTLLAKKDVALRNQQQKLQKLDQERREILRALDEQLRLSRQRQHGLSGRLQEIDGLLEQLSRVRSGRHGGLKAQQGELAWPLHGRVLRRFGQRTSGATPSRGVLIAARSGTPVPAVHGGVVAWVGWLPQKGLAVVLDHGEDYYSLYAHAESVLHSVGDTILAGRPLLHVGQTGGLNQPALYFELLNGRQALNPKRWFRDPPR